MDPARLDSKEWRHLLLAARSVFDCKGVDELRQEVLLMLEHILGSNRGTFFITDGPGFRLNTYSAVARGIEKKFLNLYRRYYHDLDPFSRKLRFTQEDVLTTEEVISTKTLVQSEYYHDFLKPQAIHHQLTIHLRSAGEWLGVVSLFRPRNARHFSEEEKLKGSLLAPYIAGALEKTLVLDKMATRERIIDSISEDLPSHGIIVLNECFSAVYQNEQASLILRDVTGKKIDPVKPMECLPLKIYRLLKDALVSAKNTPAPADECRHNGRIPLETAKRKVTLHHQIIRDQGGQPLLLIRLEPEEQVRSLEQALMDQGLTAREIEVVFLLAQGCKNAVIADRLCISEYTVDNHLKSIYRKMGVNNRTSVVFRLVECTGVVSPFTEKSGIYSA